MGSNKEKKPWTNLQNLYKNWSKGIKSDNFCYRKVGYHINEIYCLESHHRQRRDTGYAPPAPAYHAPKHHGKVGPVYTFVKTDPQVIKKFVNIFFKNQKIPKNSKKFQKISKIKISKFQKKWKNYGKNVQKSQY